MSASGCMKHSWLNNLEDKAKMCKVRLKSQMRLQRYLAAHRQWKVRNHQSVHVFDVEHMVLLNCTTYASITYDPVLMVTLFLQKHFYVVAAANRLKRFQQSRSVSTPN